MSGIAGVRAAPSWRRTGGRLGSWTFFGCFAGGAAFIVLGKMLGWPQWMVTGGPLLVILGYFGWLAGARDPRLADEAAADSLYYLGFLFTLVSLAVALVWFQREREPVEAIVSNFGIALATTICGVALRVVLLQWRADPADIEREVRMSLLDAAVELRNQLDAMIAQFKDARDRMVETALEGVTGVMDAAAAPLAAFRDRSTELLATLGTAFSDLVQNTERVRTAAARVAGGVEDLAGRIDAVAVPPDLLERKMDAALAGFSRAVEAHAAQVEAAGKGQEQLHRQLEAALRALGRVEERAGSIGAEFERMAAALGAVGTAAPAVVALGTAAEAARATLGTFGETLARQERLFAGLTLDADSTAEHLRAGREAVAAAAAGLGSDLRALAAAHETLRDAVAAHAATVADAQARQAAATPQVEEAAAAVARYAQALAEARTAMAALGAAAATFSEAAAALPAATAPLADVRTRLEAFAETVGLQAAAVQQCAERAGADAEIVRQHRAALEQELAQAREAVTEVFRTQVGLARLIVEQLDGHGPA